MIEPTRLQRRQDDAHLKALKTQVARCLEKDLNLKAEERRERARQLGIEWKIAVAACAAMQCWVCFFCDRYGLNPRSSECLLATLNCSSGGGEPIVAQNKMPKSVAEKIVIAISLNLMTQMPH